MTLEEVYRIVRSEYEREIKAGENSEPSPEYREAAERYPVMVAIAAQVLREHKKIEVAAEVLHEDLPRAQIW
jgi:hypothetical protein